VADGSSPRASPKPLSKKIRSVETSASSAGGAVQSVPDQQIRRITDGLQPTVALSAVSGLSPPGESQAAVLSKVVPSGAVNESPAIAPLAITPAMQVNVKPLATTNASIGVHGGATALLGRSQQEIPTPSAIPVSAPKIPAESVQVKAPALVPVLPQPAKVATESKTASVPSQLQEQKSTLATTPKPAMKIDTDVLRAIVEAEINQAILFKHNELRLIDQEIAKCQIALEQIRRCNLIPVPVSQIPSLALSAHSGPALVPPPGYSVPDSPAPWGVTDGPYSRHYATWLLPSPRFDPQSPEALAASALNTPLPLRDGRITRGSGLEVSTPLNPIPGRPSRSAAGRVRSLHDPASPLAGRDPLILKRQKDGQWVKLYCTSCNPERSDFANVQGFLNHCRISHKLDFKSHEAAAIECGRPVEVNEYFPPTEPTSAREPIARPAFATSFTFTADKPSVHPLNKPNAKIRDLPAAQQILPRSYSMPVVSYKAGPPTPATSPGFVPSKDTPFLSTLLSKRGFAGSLSTMVQEAKRKVDLSEYDVESDPECDTDSKPSKGKKKSNGSANNGHFKSKSASRPLAVGAHRLAPAPSATTGMRPSPLAPLAQFGTRAPGTTSPPDSSISSTDGEMMMLLDLSPNTAESNPGLVSDRDDEEDEDEADEEHVSVRKGTAGHHHDVDMLVAIEDSDGEGRHVEESQGFCSNRQA
jgi:ADA HAT complex component 1